MTISAQNVAVSYTGNGVTTVFAYPFRILDATHLKVYINGTLQPTGYSVSGVDASGGGNVTFVAAPANGAAVLFQRVTAKTQDVDYVPYDPFPSETHERALDKLTMLVQESASGADHSIKIPPSEDISVVNTTLPAVATRSGQFVTFDVNGNVTVALPSSGAPISAAWQPVVNAATIAAGRALFTPLTTKGDLWAFGAADTRMPAGSDNQALLADSSQSTGLKYVTLGAGDKRQSVLSSALDANGYANAITTGAGLRPGLDASPTPMVVTFAAGYSQQGAADLITTLSADVADPLGADLKTSNTAYVHATYTNPAAVTWAACYVPPDYGNAFDRTRGSLCNFEGINGATTTTDDFGNTWTLTTATISTAQKQFGNSSLDMTGGAKFARTSDIKTLGDGSWEASVWLRWNALPTAGTTQLIFAFQNASNVGAWMALNNTAGTIKTALFLSSNGTTNDVANGTLGANTVWAINTWYRFRLVYDALAGNYKIYLSVAGAAESLDQTVAITSKICAITTVSLGRDLSASGDFNGWADAFRFIRAATITGTETPAGAAPTITDYPYHFFSIPEMKMYEVTAASGAAGVNPTLTARNRCFVAECDTSGAAVTAVRNYALRGQYDSGYTSPLPGTSTAVVKNHNIGTPRVSAKATLRCITNNTGGYNVGDEIVNHLFGANVSYAFNITLVTTRNSLTLATANSVSITNGNKAGGDTVNLTAANFAYRVLVTREF